MDFPAKLITSVLIENFDGPQKPILPYGTDTSLQTWSKLFSRLCLRTRRHKSV